VVTWVYEGDYWGTYTGSVLVQPRATPSTGTSEMAIQAGNGPPSGGINRYGMAGFRGASGVGLTFTGLGRSTYVTYSWTLQFDWSDYMEQSNGDGRNSIDVYVYAIGDVYDHTTGTWIVPGHVVLTVLHNHIGPTDWSNQANPTVRTSVTVSVPFTDVYGHVYQLYTYAQCQVHADMYGGPYCESGGLVNMEYQGNGATCTQMKVQWGSG